MKCDDFLPRLATGGWFSRWLARRHAGRCPSCAAAASLLGELNAEQSMAPLPAHLRKAWLAAARQERSLSGLSVNRPEHAARTWRVVAACAAACLILLSATIVRWPAKPLALQAPNRPAAERQGPATKDMPPRAEVAAVAVTEIDAAAQLAWLETRVVELQNDVERLEAAAQKRELSQRIESLLASHSDW